MRLPLPRRRPEGEPSLRQADSIGTKDRQRESDVNHPLPATCRCAPQLPRTSQHRTSSIAGECSSPYAASIGRLA